MKRIWRRQLAAAAASLAVCAGTLTPGTATAQMPPVVYQGSLRTEARVSDRSSGDRTTQFARTARLGANSFIWQPWFATVDARLDLSQVDSSGSNLDTSSEVVTGQGRVLMFPRSHFPLEAFVNVSDTKTELGNTLDNSADSRTTRFGLLQRYRDKARDTDYSARYEHLIEDTPTGGQIADLFGAQMNRRVDAHEFIVSGDVDSRRRKRSDQSSFDAVVSGRHSFRPDNELSVESVATLTNLTRDSRLNSSTRRTALLTSNANWRPDDSKWTVTGRARAFTSQTDSGFGDATSYNGNASLGATYRISRELRASGSLSGSVNNSDAGTTYSSGQSASISYSPLAIDLAGFAYSWNASTTASNRLDEDGASPAWSASLGHNLGRGLPLTEDGTWSLSTNLNESVSTSLTSDTSNTSLNHGASAVLTRSVGSNTSVLQLNADDSRNYGTNESEFQSLSLQATHNATLSRHSSMTATFTSQYVRQSTDTGTFTSPVSSLSMSYRQGFLFGVRRLRFNTELSASSDSLLPFTTGEEGDRRVTWDNRLEYSIGRVDVNLRGTLTDRSGRRDTVVFLSVTRSFDGVF